MDHILCKSMKLWAMPCRATQDRWRVLTKGGPLEKGTGNHFSILALKTPWSVWKGKRYDLARWGPRSVGFQKATGEERKNSLRKKNEEAEPMQKGHPLVDVSVGESKFWHYKEKYCIWTGNGRSMNQGKFSSVQFSPVQSLSHVQLFVTPWTAACQASLSFSISQMFVHVHWICNAIQPSHSLSLSSPSTFNLYHIRLLSNEPALHIRWPKYWSFSFSISPSKE